MMQSDALTVGERLMLVPFGESDITDEYIGWLNDPDVVRFSNQRFRHHDRETSLAYLHTFTGTDNLFVSVRERESGKRVGTMTAYVSRIHGTADMGILIGNRQCWGQGYGLEAWKLLMAHLLKNFGLRKITAGTLRCNQGMVRIMERSSMQLEGVRAKQELVEGVPQDVLYFARFATK